MKKRNDLEALVSKAYSTIHLFLIPFVIIILLLW